VVSACEKCFLLKKECSFSLYSQSTHMGIWCVVKACIHRAWFFFLKNMNLSVMLQLILTQVSAVTGKEENM